MGSGADEGRWDRGFRAPGTTKSAVRLVDRAPTPEEYRLLRSEVGWVVVEDASVRAGLDGALFSVCLETTDGEIVGCARVVGDGGIYFYVQDVVVREPWRGLGHGARLMDAVMDFLEARCGSGSFVGLMAAEGVTDFYRRYGFEVRPEGRPGMYRTWAAPDG